MPNLNLPEYNFKRLPELGWVIFAAMAVELAQVALTFNPEMITDWNTWGIALGTALVIAVGKATLAWFGARGKFS